VLTITFNGLSKNYRSCGYRAGWMVVSGEKRHARDYIDGLDMLASMRLCANVPGSGASRPRWAATRASTTWSRRAGACAASATWPTNCSPQIPGVSCVKPKAALYMFPRLDPKLYPIADDQQFILELLAEEKVLLVQGTGFNWPHPDHFRLVFLPHEDDLREAIGRIARFLDGYRKRHGA
jgi:alanine-synthesizing transaminase